jgi:hypothetical protein
MASQLDLAQLCAEADLLNRVEGHRWQVSHADSALRAYVKLSPLGFTDLYCLRLDFGESLSSGPPSVTFCDPETLAEGSPQHWPAGLTNYFKHPPNNGVGWICSEWTREGRQQHAEWRRSWKPTRVMWRVTTAIQDILDKPGNYTGRHK